MKGLREHQKGCVHNPANKTTEQGLQTEQEASGPKRIIADITPESAPALAKASEPESADSAGPPQKLPRIEPDSAAGPPRAVPPTALPGAEAPKDDSSLTQPMTKPISPPTRKLRRIDPAVKAARVRIKRNVTARSLTPFAGGKAKAKKMLKELEAEAARHGLDREPISPNVATTEAKETEEAPPSTSLLDNNTPEPEEQDEETGQKRKKSRADPELVAPQAY